MTVITLARQVGSGGHAVAQALSERLELRVIGRKELQEEASKRDLSLPESFVRFASEDGNGGVHQYLTYSELEFDLALRGGPHLPASEISTGFLIDISSQSRDIFLTLHALICELAAQDNVLLVGAGAQIVLSELPQVLRIKIIAPVETRIERMRTAYGLAYTDARAAVEAGDHEQIDYNLVIFGEDWHNPELWDVVLNSESLSVEAMVEVIASAATPGNRIGEVDRYLTEAASINRVLLSSPLDTNTFVWASPTPTGVAIRGDISSEESIGKILELVNRRPTGVPITFESEVHQVT